ncbi:MAG: hypothetical protein PHX27_04525 [Candidatus ainarchaeum sp.]|nr:hypothetical protein [Candidatus ainarchaeum sp.]
MIKQVFVILVLLFLSMNCFADGKQVFDYCGGHHFFSEKEDGNINVYRTIENGSELIYTIVEKDLSYFNFSCCGEDLYLIVNEKETYSNKTFKILKNSNQLIELFSVNKFDNPPDVATAYINTCAVSDQYFSLNTNNYEWEGIGKSVEGSTELKVLKDTSTWKESFVAGGDYYGQTKSNELLKSTQGTYDYNNISRTIYKSDGNIWQNQSSFNYTEKFTNDFGGFNDVYFVEDDKLFKSIEGDLNLYFLGTYTGEGYFGFDDFYYSCNPRTGVRATCVSYGGSHDTNTIYVGANFNDDESNFYYNYKTKDSYLFLDNGSGHTLLRVTNDLYLPSLKKLNEIEIIFENLKNSSNDGYPNLRFNPSMSPLYGDYNSDKDILFFSSYKNYSSKQYFYDSNISPAQLIEYIDFYPMYEYHPQVSHEKDILSKSMLFDYAYKGVDGNIYFSNGIMISGVEGDLHDEDTFLNNLNILFNYRPKNWNLPYYKYFKSFDTSLQKIELDNHFTTISKSPCGQSYIVVIDRTLLGHGSITYDNILRINKDGTYINLKNADNSPDAKPFFYLGPQYINGVRNPTFTRLFFCGGDAYFANCNAQGNCDLRKNPENANTFISLDKNFDSEKYFCFEGGLVWFNKKNELYISPESTNNEVTKELLTNDLNKIFIRRHLDAGDIWSSFFKKEFIFSDNSLGNYSGGLYKVRMNGNTPFVTRLSEKATGLAYCGDKFYFSTGNVSSITGFLYNSKLSYDTNNPVLYLDSNGDNLNEFINSSEFIPNNSCNTYSANNGNADFKHLQYVFTFNSPINGAMFSPSEINFAYSDTQNLNDHSYNNWTTIILNKNDSSWIKYGNGAYNYYNDLTATFCDFRTTRINDCSREFPGFFKEHMFRPEEKSPDYLGDYYFQIGPTYGRLVEKKEFTGYLYAEKICDYVCDYGWHKVGEMSLPNEGFVNDFCLDNEEFCFTNEDCCDRNCFKNICAEQKDEPEPPENFCGDGILDIDEECESGLQDCVDGYFCSNCKCYPIGVEKNSIIDLTASGKNNIIQGNIFCLNETIANLKLFDSTNKLLEDKNVDCNTNTTYKIEKELENNKTYYITATIKQPCKQCSKDTHFSINKTSETGIAIPDNNISIIILLLLTTIIFSIKKINNKLK